MSERPVHTYRYAGIIFIFDHSVSVRIPGSKRFWVRPITRRSELSTCDLPEKVSFPVTGKVSGMWVCSQVIPVAGP